mgnify:CR=1 FL=1
MISARELRATADDVNERAAREKAERARIEHEKKEAADRAAEATSRARSPELLATLDDKLRAAALAGKTELRVMELSSWEYIPPAEWQDAGRDNFRGAARDVYDRLLPPLKPGEERPDDAFTVFVQTDYDPPSGYSWNYLVARW